METAKKFYLPGPDVPEELYAWLKERAEASRRSMTQQMIWELEERKKEATK